MFNANNLCFACAKYCLSCSVESTITYFDEPVAVNRNASSTQSIPAQVPVKTQVQPPIQVGTKRTAAEILETNEAVAAALLAAQLRPTKKKKMTAAATKKKAAAAAAAAASVSTANLGSAGGALSDEGPKKVPPGPILPLDVRRTYPKMLLNTFNSCDLNRLTDVINRHTVEDFIALHRYEGIQNPYGRNLTKLKGRTVVLNLWQSLFKSAPDFFFNPLETRAFYDPEYRVVVACKFTWSGTRVMDIKYAENVNELVLKKKLANPSQFTTDEDQLLLQLKEEREKRTPNATNGSSNNNSTGNASRDAVHRNDPAAASSHVSASEAHGLFFGPGDLIIEATDTVKQPASFFLDEAPLARRMEMRCKGTFILYLNDDNLIYKYEFVYISMDELEQNAAAATSTTPDAAAARPISQAMSEAISVSALSTAEGQAASIICADPPSHRTPSPL